jgi:hypothetical protein
VKVLIGTLSILIVLAFYIVLSQGKFLNDDEINYEWVYSLSDEQLEDLSSRLLLCRDNQFISKKDFNSLSKKKQRIIIAWLSGGSKTSPLTIALSKTDIYP